MYNIILVSGYNPMIRHLYNFQSEQSYKTGTHLTPYIVITILLTIFPMLYFTFL